MGEGLQLNSKVGGGGGGGSNAAHKSTVQTSEFVDVIEDAHCRISRKIW